VLPTLLGSLHIAQNDTPQVKPTHKDKKAKSEKSSNGTKNPEFGKNDKYCWEHGKNSTHNMSDCFTLKNRKDNGQNGNEKNGKTVGRPFSNRNFRKELNAMAKNSSKKEALDLYTSAIAREQTKYDKAHKKKALAKRKVLLSDSEEDSSNYDESFHLIKKKKSSSKKTNVQFVSEPEKPDKKKQKSSNKPTAEEKAFIKQIAHLEETDESSDKLCVGCESSDIVCVCDCTNFEVNRSIVI
jgi:hypothetical protein